MLKNGNPSGTGGKRIGAGRPTKALSDKCLKIASNPKVLKFLEDIVMGKGVDPKVTWNPKTEKNEIVYVPADADTRAKVWEKLADRGAGKPPQAMTVEPGKDGPAMIVVRSSV